jgi:type 1 glutamine amidotransferase
LGDGNLTDLQKADLLSFVHDDGKGLIAAHATATAFANWPEWGEMLGGAQAGAFSVGERSIIVEDPGFPGMSAFPKSFTFLDEFPILKAPYSRDNVHVLMRVDASKAPPPGRARRDDGDYPIVWAKMYGKGRVFFSGFGHPEATWDDTRLQKMYVEAIKWAMGLTDADIKPRPMAASGK